MISRKIQANLSLRQDNQERRTEAEINIYYEIDRCKDFIVNSDYKRVNSTKGKCRKCLASNA